jgi:O-acetyl-ADP-ribose deacetylase (regulator of RNase III)
MPPVAERRFPGGGTFAVVLGTLLEERVDGIVNAANSHLAHGGGVAGAISAAAGPELDAEGDRIVRARGPVPVGSAVLTTAGRLPFKGVIHAVGPRLGEGDEEERLAAALRSAFDIAHDEGWASLSFPAVSSGIFAVPADVCARAHLRAVDRFFAERPGSPLKTIRLVLFPGPMADAVQAAVRSSPLA